MREAKFVAWFFLLVGTGVALLSAWAAVTLSAPPQTISLLRNLMAKMLGAMLGEPAGFVAYHLVWTALGACVASLALRTLREQRK